MNLSKSPTHGDGAPSLRLNVCNDDCSQLNWQWSEKFYFWIFSNQDSHVGSDGDETKKKSVRQIRQTSLARIFLSIIYPAWLVPDSTLVCPSTRKLLKDLMIGGKETILIRRNLHASCSQHPGRSTRGKAGRKKVFAPLRRLISCNSTKKSIQREAAELMARNFSIFHLPQFSSSQTYCLSAPIEDEMNGKSKILEVFSFFFDLRVALAQL